MSDQVADLQSLRELKTELPRFMMADKFVTDEMMTKINILKEEFSSVHDWSPIEHVSARLKSHEGILKKALRKGCPLSDRVQRVTVDFQIRTISMDFWASLKHKIFYKCEGAGPETLQAELKQAADVASRLNLKMEGLHDQVVVLGSEWVTDHIDPQAGLGWLARLPMSRDVLQVRNRRPGDLCRLAQT